MQNYIITDAMNPAFQRAFKMYFEELGVSLRDWSSLFQEMNEDPGTKILMEMAEHNLVIGFIMVKIDALSNWFFEEKIGFIREFWIDPAFRNQGYGKALLQRAEVYFVENEIFKAILTTDTAPDFYKKSGYKQDTSYTAKNKDDVYTKLLKQ